jgi:hypothetical protein
VIPMVNIGCRGTSEGGRERRESKEVKKKGKVDVWTMWSLGCHKRELRVLKIDWAPRQWLLWRAMSVDREEKRELAWNGGERRARQTET